MRRVVYGLTTFLLGTLVLTTGCVSNKRHQRDVASLQTQIGALQSEVVRLDQALKESEMALRAGSQRASASASAGSNWSAQTAGGPIYRTPSGFELPAVAIQRALKNAGYYRGAIDGRVGARTKEAIRNFQRDHGLTVDGVCGRQTWALLKGFLEGSGAAIAS